MKKRKMNLRKRHPGLEGCEVLGRGGQILADIRRQTQTSAYGCIAAQPGIFDRLPNSDGGKRKSTFGANFAKQLGSYCVTCWYITKFANVRRLDA